MSLTEAYSSTEDHPSATNAWDTLVRDYTYYPEYEGMLDGVPAWGKKFLVDLHDHHPDSFAHSLRTAATVSNLLRGDLFAQDTRYPYLGMIPYSQIKLAALLHDVGKSDVPSSILDFPGKPTEEGWRQVQRHVVAGYEAIEPHDPITARIVGGHHMVQGERSYGYPGGENVAQDIIAARVIVAAADVADALGSRRAYKEPMPPDRVRTIMLQQGHFPRPLVDSAITARFNISQFAVPSERRTFPGERTVFQARA